MDSKTFLKSDLRRIFRIFNEFHSNISEFVHVKKSYLQHISIIYKFDQTIYTIIINYQIQPEKKRVLQQSKYSFFSYTMILQSYQILSPVPLSSNLNCKKRQLGSQGLINHIKAVINILIWMVWLSS